MQYCEKNSSRVIRSQDISGKLKKHGNKQKSVLNTKWKGMIGEKMEACSYHRNRKPIQSVAITESA